MYMVLGMISIAVLIVLIIVIAMLIVQRKVNRIVLLGVIGIVTVMVFLTYNLFFYYNEKEVTVSMSTDEYQSNFTLEIENRKLNKDLLYTEFITSLSLNELMQFVKDTYPNDKVVVYDNGFKITKDNKVISIKQHDVEKFLWKKRNVYVMRTECISLEVSTDNFISIPFPKEYIGQEGAYQTTMNITCGIEELKEFYADFTNVRIEGNSIIIEQDKKIIMTIRDNKIIIELE